jgi:hypothetical protein
MCFELLERNGIYTSLWAHQSGGFLGTTEVSPAGDGEVALR